MTKRAPIKQAELNRLAAVAKRNNITIEVEAEGYTIRLHPTLTEPSSSRASAPERDPAWDIPWEDIPPEPIQPPLNWRERKAMDYLMAHGAEVRVDWYALKDYGSHTQKKLEERGFVQASSETDRYGHPDQIWLTKAGQRAMRDQRAHRDKYPCL
ncbi:hypothetical protein GOC48_03715 [Sinorhizobium meliloti]|nr:hypothetical protein [Sinorhizobium meliloti]